MLCKCIPARPKSQSPFLCRLASATGLGIGIGVGIAIDA